jgi:tetratricopeptide (TPR) repeat protein
MLNSFKSISRLGSVVIASAVLGVCSAFAEGNNAPELSESVASGIAPLSALFEAKKWDEALKAIDALITKTEPVSFDRAFLSQLKAQIYGSKGDYGIAVQPLETALKIADELQLFRFTRALPINEQETLINLASLYMQDASTPGKSLDYQRAAYAKAHIYGQRLASAKKPTIDGQTMWARILYSEATLDSNKVDIAVMKQAAVEAEKALYLTIKPKEENYTLLLATLQQLGETARCADLLELMVKKFPNSKSYWPVLFNTYVSMQGSTDKRILDVDLSAVIALERAQAAGQMTTNKDNYMLAGLYYNIQQYAFAAELLEKGLRNGTIDPEQKNWELLAASYQQVDKESRAIDTFLEAIRLFPKSSNLELQVGQIYYNAEKHDDAFKHLQAAVAKGLEKPGQTLILLSYLSLENKRLDEALVFAEKAVKADPKSKDAQNILKVIQDSITDRDNFKKSK